MVTNEHYRWDFIGLSTDTKPTPANSEKVVDGSTYYCSDTSKLYVYCKNNWYERKALGGGGGTSYTAGNGIDISNDTISVDTDVIQEKLTAGDNITIENGTISAAGSSVNVVQTTGTSTTDVMSQDASTKLVFDTTNTNYENIKIGETSSTAGLHSVGIGKYHKASGTNTVVIGSSGSTNNRARAEYEGGVAIGFHAQAVGENSIALGSYSNATRKGVFSVDTGSPRGYNNSAFRLLTGIYDGQTDNDAVTVGQVNATIDAINTALSTSIPHIGATS